MVMLAAMDRS